MKREVSAGGVVVTKTSTGRRVLLMQDVKGRWTFPKGLIEKNEESVEAAKREVAEEVGISDTLVLVKPLAPIEYFYFRGGSIKKTVYYFLFESPTLARLKTQRGEGIVHARWIPLEEAIKLIDYKDTNIPLLTEVANIIKALKMR